LKKKSVCFVEIEIGRVKCVCLSEKIKGVYIYI
jgi:uncharacterized protein (UPF0212 family)